MMKRITYPEQLKSGDIIAVTAPSSGVEEEFHFMLNKSKNNLEEKGYRVQFGNCLWNEQKCVSAPKEERANELLKLMKNDDVKLIMPPWGGHFLIDILHLLDWEELKKSPAKWIHGYSDISTLAFTYTINTGHASSHGTNFVDLSAPTWDETTVKWEDVLQTKQGELITQNSSKMYQSSWDEAFNNPGTGFRFDQKTEWKSLSGEEETMSGRLLGGCLDVLVRLVGTPYGNVSKFVNDYCKEDGVLWYLESCNMTADDIYRSLWQMKTAGWFEHISGFMFGRPSGYDKMKDFTLEDALKGIFDEFDIPIVYDVDIGHMPPQLTLINGAIARVEYENGKGKIEITMK
jgi:muramoyltetrapeptide carboxypeptidase